MYGKKMNINSRLQFVSCLCYQECFPKFEHTASCVAYECAVVFLHAIDFNTSFQATYGSNSLQENRFSGQFSFFSFSFYKAWVDNGCSNFFVRILWCR